MALRRSDGFFRYAVALQYHGASFLGFPYLGERHEDCILPDGKDLRGFRSVEGRLREALVDTFGEEHGAWENIQVSSRTDRGVHALRNTLHVDVHSSAGWGGETNDKSSTDALIVRKLARGLNFHLSRQGSNWERDASTQGHLQPKQRQRQGRRRQSSRGQVAPFTFLGADSFARHSVMNEMRILSAARAPEFMPNSDYGVAQKPPQPAQVDWNARFSATKRTYVYRVLCYPYGKDNRTNENSDIMERQEYGSPFEWDRSWRVRGSDDDEGGPLDLDAMRTAAALLEGTHDFSSFRGAKCQRSSPVVTLQAIHIHSQPYGPVMDWLDPPLPFFGLLGLGSDDQYQPNLVTIAMVGNSFLYRQVRNMVGCLLHVGRGRMKASEVLDLLQAKQRSEAPSMAPAHGLFLVNVEHDQFSF